MKTVTKPLMIALCGMLMYGTVSASGPEPAVKTEADQVDEAARKKPFQVGMYRVIHTLSMNVLIEKKLGERVIVKLLDPKGHVLYQDYMGVKQKKYARKFDFSEVPDGKYAVVITNGDEEIVKDIRLSTQKLYEMPARSLVAVN
jgi:hypothetical protein